MLALLLFFAFGTFLLFYWHLSKRKRFQNLPQGPTGLPIIGNILQLGSSPHFTLTKWAKEFGKLYTISVFGTPTLVINDPRAMRDIFGNMNSTGKYSNMLIDIVHSAEYGMGNTEGSVWYEQHKFFIKVLRQFGFRGGSQLNPIILSECDKLCSWIDKEMKQNESCTLYLNKKLINPVANVFWNTITGQQQQKDNSEIGEMLAKIGQHFTEAFVLTFMPWLRYIAPGLSGYSNLVKSSSELHKKVENTFEEHKVARKLGTEKHSPGNVIDAYLDQLENCNDPASSFYGDKGMKHSLFCVVSLLVAGSETTASTMNWIIHYLLVYPDIQRKVQQEVDAVLEKDPNTNLVDKSELPYLRATILEVLRITTLLPFGVLHKMLEDVTYNGITLPKGLYLLPNVYHVNMNPDIWGDPEAFRPERFLEGTEAQRQTLRDCVVTFQEGRRKCPGEQITKEVLLMITFKLVEKYSFHKEENRDISEYLKPVMGLFLVPTKLGIVVKRRNQ